MRIKIRYIFAILFVFIISFVVSWALVIRLNKFFIMFSELEKVPYVIKFYSIITYIPNLLTGIVYADKAWLFGSTWFYFNVFNVFFVVEISLVLSLIFCFFLIMPNKKLGMTTAVIVDLLIVFLLFLPMFVYGNLYSENNSKPKMVYCLQNSYLDRWDDPKKEMGFNDCVHDSIYWIIDRDGGLTNEKSAFDSDKVKKYCSNLPDKPLPTNIQKFNTARAGSGSPEYSVKINFNGYKILTQRDFCFASFAYELWPAGEFRWTETDVFSQLKLCNNVPDENNRRDYCLYYAIIKKIADDAEKQNMCRMINNPDMENTCLINYHIEGNFDSLDVVNIDMSNLEETDVNLVRLPTSRGDIKESSGKIVLTKNVLSADGSAFFDAYINKKDKDILLNIQYKFIDIGHEDQFGIWLNDQMKFVSTGSVIGNSPQKAIINISKLNSGTHILNLALHSYKGSTAPAKIEIENISISSLK